MFDVFQALVIQLGPKECLLSHVSGQTNEGNKLKQVVERNGLLISERKRGMELRQMVRGVAAEH